MLNPEENEVLELLGRAFDFFHDLPILHPSDQDEFIRAIHAAQNIVMARPVLRAQNIENEEGRSVARQIGHELRTRALIDVIRKANSP